MDFASLSQFFCYFQGNFTQVSKKIRRRETAVATSETLFTLWWTITHSQFGIGSAEIENNQFRVTVFNLSTKRPKAFRCFICYQFKHFSMQMCVLALGHRWNFNQICWHLFLFVWAFLNGFFSGMVTESFLSAILGIFSHLSCIVGHRQLVFCYAHYVLLWQCVSKQLNFNV